MALNVELVSPQERVWSGQAKFISARTIEGDLGVLPDHAPLFGVLVDGVVRIDGVDGTSTLNLVFTEDLSQYQIIVFQFLQNQRMQRNNLLISLFI